jgi:hypothetical protein
MDHRIDKKILTVLSKIAEEELRNANYYSLVANSFMGLHEVLWFDTVSEMASESFTHASVAHSKFAKYVNVYEDRMKKVSPDYENSTGFAFSCSFEIKNSYKMSEVIDELISREMKVLGLYEQLSNDAEAAGAIDIEEYARDMIMQEMDDILKLKNIKISLEE